MHFPVTCAPAPNCHNKPPAAASRHTTSACLSHQLAVTTSQLPHRHTLLGVRRCIILPAVSVCEHLLFLIVVTATHL